MVLERNIEIELLCTSSIQNQDSSSSVFRSALGYWLLSPYTGGIKFDAQHQGKPDQKAWHATTDIQFRSKTRHLQ